MTKMNQDYFKAKYYSAKDLAVTLETELQRLRMAMKYVSFPPADLQVGATRLWLKETAEPYFPQLLKYVNGTFHDRRLEEIIADIRVFLDERNYSESGVLHVSRQYLSWTEQKCSERTIARYGGWMPLVMKANGEEWN